MFFPFDMPTKDQVHRLIIHMASTFTIHMPLMLDIILKRQLVLQSTLVVLTIILNIPMLQLRTNMFLISKWTQVMLTITQLSMSHRDYLFWVWSSVWPNRRSESCYWSQWYTTHSCYYSKCGPYIIRKDAGHG